MPPTNDGIHVIHVDDDQEFADMVATFLEREDERFSVETATSPAKAMDQLATTNVDCLVSDYDMPGRNGLELLEAVRSEHDDLPFILFTGKGSEEVASDAISAGATDYLQKEPGTDQYTLLANRIQNAVKQVREQQHRATLERIRHIVNEINQALIRASSQQEIETQVCETFADSDPYQFSVIAGVSPESKQIEPQTWAGTGDGFLDEFEMSVEEGDPGRQAPGGRAFHNRDIAVAQRIKTDPTYEKWRDLALEHQFKALAVIPIEHESAFYGLLAIFADRPHAFDDIEREMLAELSDDIAHAMHAQDLWNELQNERRFITQALDALDELFYVINPNGEIRRWNDRVTDITGYAETDIRDMGVEEFFAPADRSRVADAIEKAATTGRARLEADLLTRDGDRIPYEFTGSRLIDAQGDVIGIVGIGRDLTVRKQQQQQRQQIIDRVTDAIVEVDADWQFTLVNDQAEELYGMAETELLGRDFWDVFAEAKGTRFEETYREVMETREPSSIVEYYTGLDGWFDIQVYPNDDGGLAFYFRDVTDRKQRSQELERVEAQYQTLAENFPNGGVHYFDEDLRYQSVSGSGFEPIDTSPEDLVGNTIYEVEPYSEEIIQTLEPVMEATLEGERKTTEVAYEGHVYRLRTVPVRDPDGDVTAGFFITQDVTDQRKREQELEQKNERLEDLARVVSHDLRNPLNVAAGHLELAQEDYESDHLDRAAQAVDRSLDLVEDLLTLAREGDELGAVEPVALAEVADDCWQAVSTGEGSLVVKTDLMVRADRSRLQQLIENLIRNAIDHAGEDVRVSIGELEDGFYVADNGPGIPEDERDAVFEQGYSTSNENTGFGLNIVKRIVQAHDWQINVTESESGGARFEITDVDVTES